MAHHTPSTPRTRGRALGVLTTSLAVCAAALAATKLSASAPTMAADPTPAFRPDPERAGSYLVRPDVQPALRTHTAELACHTGGAPCVPRIAVPLDAVRGAPAAPRLMVRTSPASVEPRAVRLGEAFDSLVEVIEGVEAGERVVVAGADLAALR